MSNKLPPGVLSISTPKLAHCAVLGDVQWKTVHCWLTHNIDTLWREGVTEGRGEGLEIGPGSDCDQIS